MAIHHTNLIDQKKNKMCYLCDEQAIPVSKKQHIHVKMAEKRYSK